LGWESLGGGWWGKKGWKILGGYQQRRITRSLSKGKQTAKPGPVGRGQILKKSNGLKKKTKKKKKKKKTKKKKKNHKKTL